MFSLSHKFVFTLHAVRGNVLQRIKKNVFYFNVIVYYVFYCMHENTAAAVTLATAHALKLNKDDHHHIMYYALSIMVAPES